MVCLVAVAVNAMCRLLFVHTFKSSKRGKTVNERVKDEGHYTFMAESRGKISKMHASVCSKCRSLKKRALCKKRLYFIEVIGGEISVSFCLIGRLA